MDQYVLRTGAGVTLAFYQDLDGDLVPAPLEFLNNTTDSLMDTDADGLDDRFEIFEGWSVNIAGQGERPVFSSPSLRDTDRDGLSDLTEALGARFDRRGRPIGLADANDNRLTLKENINDEDSVLLQNALLQLNLSVLDGSRLQSNVPSVDVDTDTIFVGGVKGLSTGDTVTYKQGGADEIGGLEHLKDYLVINAGDGKIQLALNQQDVVAGRAINLTGLGANADHTITFVNANTETVIHFNPHHRTIQFTEEDGTERTLSSLTGDPNRELRLRVVDPGSALLATMKVVDPTDLTSGIIIAQVPLELVDVVGLMSGLEAEIKVRDSNTTLPLRMVYNAKTTDTNGIDTGTTTGARIDVRGVVRLVKKDPNSSDPSEPLIPPVPLIPVNIFNREVELGDVRRALIDEVRPTASAEILITAVADPFIPDTAKPKGGIGEFPLQELQTDPSARDTDADGVSDLLEIRGFDVVLRRNLTGVTFSTDPTNPDTDGDTASDGLEKRLGGNPTDLRDKKDFADNDGDGLVNIEELDGWEVQVEAKSTQGLSAGSVTTRFVSSDPNNPDTDGDGLLDGEELDENTDPGGRPITDLGRRINVFMSPDGKNSIVDIVTSNSSFRVVSGGVVEIDANGDGVLDAVVNALSPKAVAEKEISGGDRLELTLTAAGGITFISVELNGTLIAVVSSNGETQDPVVTVGVGDAVQATIFAVTASGKDQQWRVSSFPIGNLIPGFTYKPSFSTDTDQDGLTDFQEVRGFIPPRPDELKIGVIVTDPSDADTDNDKLSDGEEAEFEDIEANRWIVRLENKAPYRTWSDPLQADADFDRLVDGDESVHETDPNNADSDGDLRLDEFEVTNGLNPLRVEPPAKVFNVTVVFESLVIEDYSGDCPARLSCAHQQHRHYRL